MIDWPASDSNGYSDAPPGYVYGSNPTGFKRHLVEPEPYNRTALCGMLCADTSTGAILKPYGRSHVCTRCIAVANLERVS